MNLGSLKRIYSFIICSLVHWFPLKGIWRSVFFFFFLQNTANIKTTKQLVLFRVPLQLSFSSFLFTNLKSLVKVFYSVDLINSLISNPYHVFPQWYCSVSSTHPHPLPFFFFFSYYTSHLAPTKSPTLGLSSLNHFVYSICYLNQGFSEHNPCSVLISSASPFSHITL